MVVGRHITPRESFVINSWTHGSYTVVDRHISPLESFVINSGPTGVIRLLIGT